MKRNHKYSEKVGKDNRTAHLNSDKVWIIKITVMAFFLSLLLSLFSDAIIPNVPFILSLLILILFIILGIVFDMVGVSVTVADRKVFNSMAAKRIMGAKTALWMIKNNSKVSSFCNDVVGDICGIISGAAGITIGVLIANITGFSIFATNLVLTSIIASATIGGKAVGKSYAINKANKILYRFAKFVDIITFKFKKN